MYPRRHLQQRGSALIIGLIGAFIAMVLTIVLFNTGSAVNKKIQLINATDAAAYSVGVYAARHLNFMAYTNRAMLANHLAAGHSVAYISWLRYTDQQIQAVGSIGQYLPYVGPAIKAMAEAFEQYKEFSDSVVVPGYLGAITSINSAIHGAQLLAKADSILRTLPKLSSTVAKSYDSRIRVNNLSDIKDVPSIFKLGAAQAVVTQYTSLLNFTERYTLDSSPITGKEATKDKYTGIPCGVYGSSVNCSRDLSAIKEVSNLMLSASPSSKWITNRKVGNQVPRFISVFVESKKTGPGKTNENLDDWEMEDRMWLYNNRIFSDFHVPVGRGSASAQELYSAYKSMPGYVDIDRGKIDAFNTKNEFPELTFDYYASMPLNTPVVSDVVLNKASTKKLFARARVKIHYKRPLKISSKKNSTYGFDMFKAKKRGEVEMPNLFNPFWAASLMETPLL